MRLILTFQLTDAVVPNVNLTVHVNENSLVEVSVAENVHRRSKLLYQRLLVTIVIPGDRRILAR